METTIVHGAEIEAFLAAGRIAVVGASGDPKQWGNVLAQALREHGYDAVGVHPGGEHPTIPDGVRAVLVVVDRSRSAAVVADAIERGIRHIWLFQGIGGPGAVSEEALALCREHGVAVVPGACPLMFLEPVGFGHRIHRAIRRRRGAIAA